MKIHIVVETVEHEGSWILGVFTNERMATKLRNCKRDQTRGHGSDIDIETWTSNSEDCDE